MVEEKGEAEDGVVVFLYTIVLIRLGTELFIVVSNGAHHRAFEIEMDLFLARQFDRFQYK